MSWKKVDSQSTTENSFIEFFVVVQEANCFLTLGSRRRNKSERVKPSERNENSTKRETMHFQLSGCGFALLDGDDLLLWVLSRNAIVTKHVNAGSLRFRWVFRVLSLYPRFILSFVVRPLHSHSHSLGACVCVCFCFGHCGLRSVFDVTKLLAIHFGLSSWSCWLKMDIISFLLALQLQAMMNEQCSMSLKIEFGTHFVAGFSLST